MDKTPTIGLALGAGAARGLAHIGVIKTLQENDIKIDYIAGTSIGSIIAAYYALNLDVDKLEKKIFEMNKTDFLKLVDLAPPLHGLIHGEKIKVFLDELLEKKRFSDTKIPLKIIATDLYNGNEFIFDEGKLAEACRASISLPGIFVPYRKKGLLLIDGGVVSPTPTKIVKEMGADIIIGVDLPVIKTKQSSKPNIVETLIQSYEIMREKINLTKEKEIIIIEPQVFERKLNGYQFLNKEFIKKGRVAAESAIPKIIKIRRIFRMQKMSP